MVEIDKTKAKNDEVYIVKDGKLQSIDKPKYGFGKTVIHWQNGKPVRTETSYTKEIK